MNWFCLNNQPSSLHLPAETMGAIRLSTLPIQLVLWEKIPCCINCKKKKKKPSCEQLQCMWVTLLSFLTMFYNFLQIFIDQNKRYFDSPNTVNTHAIYSGYETMWRIPAVINVVECGRQVAVWIKSLWVSSVSAVTDMCPVIVLISLYSGWKGTLSQHAR